MFVKRPILLAVATAAVWLSTAVQAASSDDIAQIREQLQSLMQRVDRLEQENEALKAQNRSLQDTIVPARTPVADAPPPAAAPKAADWPNRVAVKGDLRYRHQQTDDARSSAQRDEHLLRARVNIEAQVTESIVAGVGVSTSDAGNPRGANVRMDGEFSRKPLFLDLGYVDWSFADGVHAILGKMKTPFARPGQSLYWDNDVNPEGIALTYSRGPWFGAAYGFWIEENVQYTSAPSANDTTDTKMYGAQLGGRFDLGGGQTTFAAMYYDLAAGQGRRPFFNNSSNGNSLDPTGGLLFDFQVVELMAEHNMRLADLPLQLWADVARNLDAELDTAIAAGALLGKAAAPRTWEAGVAYQILEKDALFAQHIDSDFAGGVSDSEGVVLRAAYAPLKNWVLNATLFLTQGNVDVGNEYDYDRLLLDFNVKF
jgi:outer membrane murein-binding lipoprotein Lpp